MTVRRSSAVVTGMTLGLYQAHALAGPILMVVLFMKDLYWPLVWVLPSTVIAWLGWWQHFGLAWRITLDDLERRRSR